MITQNQPVFLSLKFSAGLYTPNPLPSLSPEKLTKTNMNLGNHYKDEIARGNISTDQATVNFKIKTWTLSVWASARALRAALTLSSLSATDACRNKECYLY